MKKLTTLLLSGALLAATSVGYAQAQCDIKAQSKKSVICGECDSLSAVGSTGNEVVFKEDFNTGAPVGWSFTQAVTIADNTCGMLSPDSSNFMWMGDSSVNPRDMVTKSFDLTVNAGLGGNICFEMRYAMQGGTSPCEGPDEPTEGVYIQYSTNNGSTWETITYYDPKGGSDPILTKWNQYCISLPAGAITTNTKIRWHQDAVTSAAYDHWGVDNIKIALTSPTMEITWAHDGYSYGKGSSGGKNPTPVCPKAPTTYVVTLKDGSTTCQDSVKIDVTYPTVVVDAGLDTTTNLCSCLPLNGKAHTVVKSAKKVTYSNNELDTLAFSFSGGATSKINITDLNMKSIVPGSIAKVCIDEIKIKGNFLVPISLSDVQLFLFGPKGLNGPYIKLVDLGEATGAINTSIYTTTYKNVCFEAKGAGISSGTMPYSGAFSSSESFDIFNGGETNGDWHLVVYTPLSLAQGTAVFTGWNITFDDPALTGPATYSWSEVGSNEKLDSSLTPLVCPKKTTTYTLTASDKAGCVSSVSDQVTVVHADSVRLPRLTTSNHIYICKDGEFELSAPYIPSDSAVTYQWYQNNQPVSTDSTLTVKSNGIYKLEIANKCGTSVTLPTRFTTMPVRARVLTNRDMVCVSVAAKQRIPARLMDPDYSKYGRGEFYKWYRKNTNGSYDLIAIGKDRHFIDTKRPGRYYFRVFNKECGNSIASHSIRINRALCRLGEMNDETELEDVSAFDDYQDEFEIAASEFEETLTDLDNLSDESSINVSVYPNPFSEVFQITVSESNYFNLNLIITDVLGREIKTALLTNSITDVALSEVAKGMYSYKIVSNEGEVISTGNVVKN